MTIIFLLCVIIISSYSSSIQNSLNFTTTSQTVVGIRNAVITIGSTQINVEVVSSPQDMLKGLGYRKSLDYDSGMLFKYNDYVTPSYWMKGMEFPLDIIWIKDYKAVGFEQNVPVVSSSTVPKYSPKEPINMVLEVNAGFVQTNVIKIGDGVIIHN